MPDAEEPLVAKNHVEAIDRLIDILSFARERPRMYFDPIEPQEVERWVSGLRTGVSIFGLNWSPDHRKPPLEARGLELMAKWETDDLKQRDLSSQEVVDELLAIEIEMWQSHRASIS